MITPLRRRLRLARRGLGYGFAIALVLVAVLLGTVSQLLPLAEQHPHRVARWLSQRAGRPVTFDAVKTGWTRHGPLLELDNLRIGEGRQAFTVGDAEMLVSLYAGIFPGQAFSELRLRGVELTLERLDDGRWQVRGLPGQQQAGSDPFRALQQLGELQVVGGKLAVSAPSLGIQAHIPRIDLRMRVKGDRIRVGARAWPQLLAAPLDAVLDFDRTTGNGRAYVGAKQADLAAWSSLLRLLGVTAQGGRGRAEVWAALTGHRISAITVDAALTDVVLRGAPLDRSVPHKRFAQVEARVRWQTVTRGWRLDAAHLRIGERGQMQQLDGLVLAGGEHYALLAERVDAAPLFAIAALSNRVSSKLRRWLWQAQPKGELHDIRIHGRRGGTMSIGAKIAALGFEPVGTSPGVRGLAGTLEGDGDGFALQLEPQALMRFDWPRGFGVVHTMRLDGLVSGWREGAGWRVGTPSLAVRGDGLSLRARGGLAWQGDGTRPKIDIAADIDNTSLPVAKGFWVHHIMPPRVVQWLDMALVSGEVRRGRVLISGDLDDWPFDAQNGRFEAMVDIANGTLRFQPDWPAAQAVEAQARFVANGFSIDGRGRLGQVPIQRLHAGIDTYRNGTLTVRAEGKGDAGDLLRVLRASPLQQRQPDTFANLDAGGPMQADFEMKLPLHPGARMSLDGQVQLTDARLSDRRWNVAFDQVRGRAMYSRSGFLAEGLQVRHEGQPGKLSLRAGEGHVREPGNVFEAALEASVPAAQLIDRAPELLWLKPYLDGRSVWSVGIAVPKRVSSTVPAPTLLQLRSNLVGTALTLPAPLRKPANTALATRIDTPLPLGSGDIRVGLGSVMALRARSSNGQTGVRVALGVSHLDEPAPLSGLVATGRAAALDAIDWIALARGGREGGKGGLSLQRIDVNAQRLQLLGGVFADTRVVVVPADGNATAVRVEGASLQGALLVPGGEGAIAGRFDRVHWRSPRVVAGAVASPAAATSGNVQSAAVAARTTADTDSVDPSRIPGLKLDIDDLRVGDAHLGAARLRTRPSATGMQVDQFQSRLGPERVEANGEWTGRGAAARTRLEAEVGSENFGELLGSLGLRGRLAGGKGAVRFDAAWPGSPMDFRIDSLSGRLVLDTRDGRLLEVDPGAGRVLGLLSVGDLPRRLTLDFRDLFSKGFAFNSLKGSVQFAAGSARSDDLRIDGPAAVIDIRGAANLRAQSFDQTIEVRPKAGNLLPVAGAVVAGPIGAAIGAAANAVLRKPLGQLSSRTYRVTGPWKSPKVEVMSREQSQPSGRVPPVSG